MATVGWERRRKGCTLRHCTCPWSRISVALSPSHVKKGTKTKMLKSQYVVSLSSKYSRALTNDNAVLPV
jgi:hypothetical protein